MKCEHPYLYPRPCRLCLLDTVKELGQENEKLAAHQCQHPAGDEFGNAYCTRIKELESVLKQVQQWGADARSADSYEVFEAVRVSLIDLPTLGEKDCPCAVCCLTRELALKGGEG